MPQKPNSEIKMAEHITIITKPTHDCNLTCKYCYLEDSVEKGAMSEDVLEKSIKKVSDHADSSKWIWHGGEPLLMGIDFFKTIKEIQDFYRKQGKHFRNGIQSNGTLITDEFLDFVEESKDFHIGMSLDGPEETHNRTRIYRNGSGSFNEVMNGLNLIRNRNRNIGGGVICVINAQNINNPKEIYEFFKSEKINVKFNPLIKSGRAEKNFKDLGITSKQYGDFLLQLWDIYNEDCKKEVSIDIDPFMDVIGNIETNKPMGCNYSESCRNSFISIGPQGDIYPCGRFDGIPEFWMGNVNKNTIEEALNSEIHQNLSKRNLESVTGCGGCDYGEICNSGCMHNAYFDGDIYGKDPYCGSYKQLFKKMKEVLNIEKEKAMEAVKNE